jgi:hypothetical protein
MLVIDIALSILQHNRHGCPHLSRVIDIGKVIVKHIGTVVAQILSMWSENISVSTRGIMLIYPFAKNGIFSIHASIVVASG